MTDRHTTSRDISLAVQAAMVTLLVVALAMHPWRDRIATLSFWLMALVLALGVLATLVMVAAAWFEVRDAFRAKAGSEEQETPPSPAAATASPSPAAAIVPPPPVVLLGSPNGLDLGARGLRWFRPTPIVPPIPQIPDPPPIFQGRQLALQELAAVVHEGGVIACGAGGVGKTALLLKLAQRLAPDYPDTSMFIDLRGSASPVAPLDLMRHIIRTVDRRVELPPQEPQLSRLYRTILHDRRAILLLDDAADADQVRPLAPPESCALLVTSRLPFHLAGALAVELGALDDEAARALLGEMAPRIEEGGAECVAELARLCGHLPLALKLAGGALAGRPDVTPEGYVSRLRDERERLTPLDATLAASYDMLEEPLQTLWARLGVFSIPFRREDAAAVWDIAPDAAEDALGQLVRRGMVDWQENAERYELHDQVRPLAYRALKQTEDPRPVHRLAADRLQIWLTGEEGDPLAEDLLEEVDQWEQAEAWSEFAQRASLLIPGLHHVGYRDTVRSGLERALEVVENRLDAPRLEATLLAHLGIIARGRGEAERAIELYRRSLAILERLGLTEAEAQARHNLANVYADHAAWDRAVEAYEQSLEAFERVGNVSMAAGTQLDLGILYADRGRWEEAIDWYRKSLALYERIGDLEGLAKVWGSLGRAYAAKEDWDRAIKAYVEDLRAALGMFNIRRMAGTWVSLGMTYARKGDDEQAIKMYQQSLEQYERLGELRGASIAAFLLGTTCAGMGQWDPAADAFRQCLERVEQLGDLETVAMTQAELAKLCMAKGDWGGAIEMYEQSLEVLAQLGDLRGLSACLNEIAGLHLRMGRIEEAKPLLRRAYLGFSQLGLPEAAPVHELLVEVCGSGEAAGAYLAEVVPKAD